MERRIAKERRGDCLGGTVQVIPHVTDATVLFGDHDLIVKLEADNLATIAKAVVEHIRSVEGVVTTKTLAGADLD